MPWHVMNKRIHHGKCLHNMSAFAQDERLQVLRRIYIHILIYPHHYPAWYIVPLKTTLSPWKHMNASGSSKAFPMNPQGFELCPDEELLISSPISFHAVCFIPQSSESFLVVSTYVTHKVWEYATIPIQHWGSLSYTNIIHVTSIYCVWFLFHSHRLF